MKNYVMENGIKIQYVYRTGNITSFCIGFDAGALVEGENERGLAHIVEHMLFKGTKKRDEYKINKIFDSIFGFYNAMTNYPYVIYYGTTLSSDFKYGFELYSDVILNPVFPKEGFKEEINVILEEIKEWKDNPYQQCEDELFYNSFKKRRIKDLIIGKEDMIKSVRVENVEDFYKRHYTPQNCVISVVSSLQFEKVIDVIDKYFGVWEREYNINKDSQYIYERNTPGTFYKTRKDLKGAKIKYCFPVDFLSWEEMNLFEIFNFKFGMGTSSILYDNIRTKNGLAYDILSNIKEEKGIKLFTITLGTSFNNVNKAIYLVNSSIENIKEGKDIFDKDSIYKIIKSLRLKKELSIEKSIELCKKLSANKIMFGSEKDIFYDFEKYFSINEDDILNVVCKVLNNPSIQILKPEQ